MDSLIDRSSLHLLFIVLLGLGLYLNTLGHDYAQDDSIVITDNMFVQKGISGISGIFQHDTFYGFFKEEGKAQLVSGGRYRPLSLVTFAIEQSIFKGNPHISHFINIALYILVGIFIYILANHFLTLIDIQQASFYAFLLSILYIAHPIHTEVVANIKGRDEIMVLLFGLMAMFFLFKKESILYTILAVLSFVLALFSKENAVVWLGIIALTIIFLPTFYHKKHYWISFIVMTIATGVFLWVRHLVLGSAPHKLSTELMNNPFLKFDGSTMVPFNSTEKWTTIIQGLGKYLQLFVWPIPLTSDYYPYQIAPTTWSNGSVILSILSYILLIAAGVYGFIKKNILSYGVLVFLGTILLTSNILFPIGTIISERFLFIPSLGLCLILLFFFIKKSTKNPLIKLWIVLPIIAFWSILTILRNPVWKNDFTLLTTDVQISTNSAKAHHGAAGAYSEKAGKANSEAEQQRLAKLSNEHIQKTLEIYPLYQNAYLIQGNNYVYQRQYDKAVNSYEKLIAMNPNHEQAFANLRIALRQGGRYYGETIGDLPKANKLLIKAYELNPKDYETVRLLATSYGVMGDLNRALNYFEKAKDLQPNDGYAWLNLGKTYKILGNDKQAAIHFDKAFELDPKLKNELQ